MDAYARDGAGRFYDVMTADLLPERLVFSKLAKLDGPVPDDIRHAFQAAWIEHKHMALAVGNHSLVCAVVRKMMPKQYQGQPLRLFRGAPAPGLQPVMDHEGRRG